MHGIIDCLIEGFWKVQSTWVGPWIYRDHCLKTLGNRVHIPSKGCRYIHPLSSLKLNYLTLYLESFCLYLMLSTTIRTLTILVFFLIIPVRYGRITC